MLRARRVRKELEFGGGPGRRLTPPADVSGMVFVGEGGRPETLLLVLVSAASDSQVSGAGLVGDEWLVRSGSALIILSTGAGEGFWLISLSITAGDTALVSVANRGASVLCFETVTSGFFMGEKWR